MRERSRRLLPILLILCLIGSLIHVHRGFAAEGKNFLWMVRSNSSTLYILGSVHFLKRENYPLNPGIEKAFAQSNVLVVEANIADPTKLNSDALVRNALYPENDSLEKHVSPETYEYVKKEIGNLGLPLELVARQKPWILALTLEALELMKLGFDPGQGIDAYFLSKAQGSKKILELEGVDEQFNLLSNFSDKEQELFLLYTLKDLNLLSDETNQLVKAWSTGNVNGIESVITKTIREDRRLEPIFKRLLDDRNKGMVSKIEGYLKTKETYFVVVGAGHLVGDKGIIKMLKERGHAVEQL
jgi:uncharacterized protein YbaP (TraB family)